MTSQCHILRLDAVMSMGQKVRFGKKISISRLHILPDSYRGGVKGNFLCLQAFWSYIPVQSFTYI